ncbi:hypothetical protein IMSAGC016_01511 [Muribaculaceae bacterium]|nr:hypothetical protein IMSAGC016_01511 [Muribaculaceae bacterium]
MSSRFSIESSVESIEENRSFRGVPVGTLMESESTTLPSSII